MVNRIRGNILIIDSSEGTNIALPWPAGGAKVMASAFYSLDSTGELIITLATQSTPIIHHVALASGSGSTTHFHYGGVWIESANLLTLTQGTGYLYFG